MTSRTSATEEFQSARIALPAAYLLGIAVPAAVFIALAFGTARGEAVEIGPDSYDTSQLVMNFGWWRAAYLLAVPVFLASRRYPRLAVVAVLIASVPQWATAHIYFVRFSDSGWGDGLESFAYVYAVSMTLLFAGAATLGAVTGHRRQLRFRPTWIAR